MNISNILAQTLVNFLDDTYINPKDIRYNSDVKAKNLIQMKNKNRKQHSEVTL